MSARMIATFAAVALWGCTGDDAVGVDTDPGTDSSGSSGSLTTNTDTGPGNDETTFASGSTSVGTTGDSEGSSSGGSSSDGSSSGGSSSGGSSSEGSSSGGSSSGGSSSGGSSSEGSSDGSSSGGSSSEGSSSEGTTGEVGDFVFLDALPSDYTQVDRIGFAGTNTFMNLLGDRDAYNAASPLDDVAGMFDEDIHDSINTWHRGIPGMQTANNTGLDDDLAALGLQPCVTTQLPMDTCGTQVMPFIVPDVVRLDLSVVPGFPNGRHLQDPIADIVLAVLLLDLATHALDTFIDLDDDGTLGPSMNPLANDVPFSVAFPYLAPPHM